MDEAQAARLDKLQTSMADIRLRARERARGHREVSVAHLVAALLEEESIERAITLCELDFDEVRDVVLGTLDQERRRPWWKFFGPRESRALLEVYREALTHALSAEVDSITPVALLVWVLEHKGILADRLDAMGLERVPLLLFDAHGYVRDQPLPRGSGAASLVIHNDPYTYFQVVTNVLTTYFDLPREIAEERMLKVHREGRTVLLFPDWERAREKAEAARAYAREQGFPLQFSIGPG